MTSSVYKYSPSFNKKVSLFAKTAAGWYSYGQTGISFANGQYYTISAKLEQTGMLPGVFSIDGSNTVHFSQGNLRYVGGTWSFFENQYGLFDTYSSTSWDKFGRSTSSTTYGVSTSTDNTDYSGAFVDWGNAVAGSWSTPSTTQWQGVFANQSYGSATIDLGGGSEVYGIVLIPEHSSLSIVTGQSAWNDNTYTAAQWAEMEAAGAVFLPAAGSRKGPDVNNVGVYGIYWSSTAYDNARYVFFYEGYVSHGNDNSRYYGRSVRLVCE